MPVPTIDIIIPPPTLTCGQASGEKAVTMMPCINGNGFLFGWESAYADEAVGKSAV